MRYDILDLINTYFDDSFSESIDEQEVIDSFKDALKDYRRLVKKCKNEGLEDCVDSEEFLNDYKSCLDLKQRQEILKLLQEEVISLMSSCSSPPKDITKKYSEDLVSRIENKIIDVEENVED